MKKFITAIVALLYITTSTGADVYMHYCMGKVADWGIGHNDSKTCGKCGMEKSEAKDNGCCKDEHRFFKDDSAQKITEPNLQYYHLFASVLPSSFDQPAIIGIPSVSKLFQFSHAPPRTNGIAVYIRNCTFLI